MSHYEFSWKSPSGKEIYAQGWEPTGKPRAIILLIHGMGEHSSRYQHVAEFFNKQGIAVLANDRIGHGKSKGKRGHVPKYDQLLDDVVKLHSEATRKHGGIPVFLYGHSMGGGIVLQYLLRNPKNGLKGIIATSPALQLAFEPPAFKIMLGKLMKNVYPGFSQVNEINPQHVSRDKAEVDKYINDKLNHNKITAETGMGLLQWGKDIIEKAGKVNTPVLLMHGTDDKMISYKGTEAFANKAEGDVTLKLYDGLYHELHNEPEKMEVLQYMLDWVNSKMKA